MKTIKKNFHIVLFCFILSCLFLTICSKTSFLYSFHDWFDANAFLTMGRGMKHGLIPYRDLFEQKGPILYFLHMIASFISETNFLGVWILQIIFFTIFLFYAHRTISLYLPEKTSYYLLPILIFLILMMRSYRYGDSAEEFCLAFLMKGLYDLIRYTKEETAIPNYMFFQNGLIAGIVLWIKYTLIGFWFGFMAFFFFWFLRKREYRKLVTSALYFLCGMIVITFFILLYFGFHRALYDLFDCYFLVNIQSYTISATLIDRIQWILKTIISKSKQEYMVSILILIGCYHLWSQPKQKVTFLATFLSLFFLIVSVYGGGRAYSYYFLIFAPFCLFGLIFIYQKFFSKRKVMSSISIIIVLTTLLVASKFQHNTVDLRTTKEDYAQYQFADEIKKRNPSGTILNYGFLDGGFYLTTNTLPNIKYFQKNNIPYQNYPINLDIQRQAIEQKQIDFVILFVKKNQTLTDVLFPALRQNYHLISQHTQKVEGKMQTYYLLEKK